jgi:hypothetical protein
LFNLEINLETRLALSKTVFATRNVSLDGEALGTGEMVGAGAGEMVGAGAGETVDAGAGEAAEGAGAGEAAAETGPRGTIMGRLAVAVE